MMAGEGELPTVKDTAERMTINANRDLQYTQKYKFHRIIVITLFAFCRVVVYTTEYKNIYKEFFCSPPANSLDKIKKIRYNNLYILEIEY